MSDRPYWLTDAKIEGGIYLGFTKGQWPIQAFAADGAHASYWAAEDPANRIIIGPIPVPDDAPVLRGEKVPASHRLVPHGTPSEAAINERTTPDSTDPAPAAVTSNEESA